MSDEVTIEQAIESAKAEGLCAAVSPEPGLFICCEDAGHKGDHVADAIVTTVRWPRGQEDK